MQVDELLSAAKDLDNKELRHQINQYVNALQSGGHINNKTLDELLCIQVPVRIHTNREQFPDQRFVQQGRYQRQERHRLHHGLANMD